MPYAESDLMENRAGRLSVAQKERLRRSGRQATQLIGGGLGLFLCLGGVFFVIGQPAGLLATWTVAAMLGGGLLWLGRKVRRLQGEGVVAMVRGVVQRESEDDEGTPRYFLRVGERRLALEADDYPHFQDGLTYEVYFVPLTGYVVSGQVAKRY